MASESAVKSTREFCGETLYDANQSYARVKLTDVPSSAEGLRMLAANGSWSEMLSLAEKLEARVAAKARRHPTRYDTVPLSTSPSLAGSLGASPAHFAETAKVAGSPSAVDSRSRSPALDSAAGGPSSPLLSTDAAVDNARLPYVLVRVTANLKMRRIAAAKKVVDELGDIEGEGFRHPITRESFAPFSLRLIAAFLPLYMGAPMDSQKKLYALLEECLVQERKCREADEDAHDSSGGKDASTSPENVRRLQCTWTQRVLRVQRALLHVHMHMKQQSLAHGVVEQVLRTEDALHRTHRVLSDNLYALRHVLQLQQLLCLALHVGDAQRAREVHRTMMQVATETQSSSSSFAVPPALSNAALSGLTVMSCDAFLAVFDGHYGEAVRLLGEVMRRATEAKAALKASPSCGGDRLMTAADGSIGEETLRRWTLQEICANAQVSRATCMAYCSDHDPITSMSDLCTTIEGYVKAEPQVLCNSDPFVESMVRFYTLAGERRGNLDRLSDLLEVFRCDRDSLPSLEALV